MASRRAVIVGINKYRDSKIPELTGAVNDAEELRVNLQSFGDFEIPDAHFLTDEKAHSAHIRKAVSDLLWRPDPCDLALLYFSGHGFLDGYGNGYIAPHDMVRDEPLIYGINMAELKRLVLSAVHPSVLMILDCCHSGIPTGEKSIIDHPDKSLDSLFGSLGQEPGGEGKFIFTSSEGDQVSRELPSCRHLIGASPHPHGVFTYFLIEGLSGKASPDPSGKITLDKLVEYVESQIANQGKQKPKFYTSGASRMNLVEIARSPEKFKNYITTLLQETQELLLKEGDPIYLMDAMKNVHRLMEDAKENQEVHTLRDQACLKWGKLQDKAKGFIFDHFAELSRQLPNLNQKIMDIAEYREPKIIAALDRTSVNLLLFLGKAGMGKINFDRFVSFCKTYETQPDPGTATPAMRI